jgi:putative ATP-grasp target RiPP
MAALVQSRFPLTRTRSVAGDDGEVQPSRVRPFGLRFFRPAAAAAVWSGVPFRYCDRRQIAVADDGSDEPMLTRIASWDHTTTGNLDGNEEWKLDYTAC